MKILLILVLIVALILVVSRKPVINKMAYSVGGYSELKKQDGKWSGIPKIIIKTSWQKRDSMPQQIIDALETTIRLNPGYTLYYFDNDDVDLFMKDFSQHVYDCYEKLVPGAFKADLFRVCFLYRYGGCYSDIGHVPLVGFDEICENADIVLVSDQNITQLPFMDYKNTFSGIHNALMCSVPAHPFFEKVIEKTISNITNEYYGESPLDITGPIMIGKVFNCYFGNVCNYVNENRLVYGITKYNCDKCAVKMLKFVSKPLKRTDTFYITDTDDKELVQTKFDNYYYVMYTSKKTPRYGKLWDQKKVFKKK